MISFRRFLERGLDPAGAASGAGAALRPLDAGADVGAGAASGARAGVGAGAGAASGAGAGAPGLLRRRSLLGGFCSFFKPFFHLGSDLRVGIIVIRILRDLHVTVNIVLNHRPSCTHRCT